MATPYTIGEWTDNENIRSFVGEGDATFPYVLGVKRFLAVDRHDNSGVPYVFKNIEIYQSSDSGQTWAEADGANRIDINKSMQGFWSFGSCLGNDGTTIYVAYVDGSTEKICIRPFDTVTGAWQAAITEDGPSAPYPNVSGRRRIGPYIKQRDGGDYVVIWNDWTGSTVNYYWALFDGASWSAATQETSIYYLWSVAKHPSNNRLYLLTTGRPSFREGTWAFKGDNSWATWVQGPSSYDDPMYLPLRICTNSLIYHPTYGLGGVVGFVQGTISGDGIAWEQIYQDDPPAVDTLWYGTGIRSSRNYMILYWAELDGPLYDYTYEYPLYLSIRISGVWSDPVEIYRCPEIGYSQYYEPDELFAAHAPGNKIALVWNEWGPDPGQTRLRYMEIDGYGACSEALRRNFVSDCGLF